MCINPRVIRRTRKEIKESGIYDSNGSLWLAHKVPCGKCHMCLKKRSRDWSFRLNQQLNDCHSAAFLTFTYAEAPLSFNGHPTLVKRDWQLFMKKLRKRMPPHLPKLKYYACGEYGTLSLRPHYHAIMFNLPLSYLTTSDKLELVWNNGFVDIDQANANTIMYTLKYMQKGRFKPLTDCDDRQKEFSVMSKGLGKNYLTPQMIKYLRDRLELTTVSPGGFEQVLPRYYRKTKMPNCEELLFNDEQSEIIRQSAILAQQMNFDKMFDGDLVKQNHWKYDQIQKHQKKLMLERVKL